MSVHPLNQRTDWPCTLPPGFPTHSYFQGKLQENCHRPTLATFLHSCVHPTNIRWATLKCQDPTLGVFCYNSSLGEKKNLQYLLSDSSQFYGHTSSGLLTSHSLWNNDIPGSSSSFLQLSYISSQNNNNTYLFGTKDSHVVKGMGFTDRSIQFPTPPLLLPAVRHWTRAFPLLYFNFSCIKYGDHDFNLQQLL